ALPVSGCALPRRARSMNEYIAASERLARLFEPGAITVGIVRHVELLTEHLAGPRRVDRRDGGRDFLRIAREEGDVGTLGGENLERGKSQSVRAPVHDHFLAGQPEIHRILLSSF